MMVISVEKGTFASTNGKDHVSYLCWQPETKPKAILQLVHGMAEYIARYDAFARFMAGNGYVVFGSDHLGHGDTAKTERDLGYIAKQDGGRMMAQDANKLTRIAKEHFPGLPVVLLGHSMGSFVVRLYAAMFPNDIDALVVMGTSGANPLGGAGIFLTRVIQLFKGERHRSKFIDNMAFGGYNKMFENPRTAYDWLSVEPTNVDDYIADDKCGFLFTVSAYRTLFQLLGDVSKKGWPDQVRKDLNILLISGREDPVGNFGKGIEEVRDKLASSGHDKLEMILYDGMRHEILNESDKEKVYADILHWCDNALFNQK